MYLPGHGSVPSGCTSAAMVWLYMHKSTRSKVFEDPDDQEGARTCSGNRTRAETGVQVAGKRILGCRKTGNTDDRPDGIAR